MDIRNVMFLIDEIDKTEEISEFYYDPESDRTMVTFQKGSRSYSYGGKRVSILEKPSVIKLDGRVAFIKDMPVFEPQCILDFEKRIRVIGYNGRAKTVLPEEFHIFENNANLPFAAQILTYLREISQYTSPQSEEEAFLKREMDRLTYVHPESVLNAYLNRKPVQKRQIDSRDVIFPFRFNLSQKKALEHALTSSISVIEGPPGTGKTQTILNILANLVAVQGKSVAVVSNNNEAVKNVMEKMAKQGYGFLTAMLGKKKNQEIFFENLPKAAVEGWNCEEETDELMAQIRVLNNRLDNLLETDRKRAQLTQKLSAWKLEQEHFETYFARQEVEEIGKFPLFQANTDQILSFLAETSAAKQAGKTRSVFYKMKLVIRYGVWNQRKLRKHEAAVLLRLQKTFYKKQIETLEREITGLNRELEEMHFGDLLAEHNQLSEKSFRKYLFQTHGEMDRPHFSKKNYKACFSEFNRTFPVILSTTHALRMSIPQNYLLDYVIIDEASQVDLITGVLAFSCCKNVIVVGDVKQLPQITDLKIRDKLSADAPGTEYDYFNQNILSSILQLYQDQVPREILREHYRCHPRIIEFCNQKYYDGALIPYTTSDLSDCPLLIYRTTEGNHMRKVTRGEEKGIYNQRELDVMIQEVLAAPEYAQEREQIGIVTPYRKQADKAAAFAEDGVESDTVHKYQGREKNIMIMSTVLSGVQGASGLRFVDDPHMVNVAVSRAIRQFILVTDHDLFYQKGKHIGDLIRYIQYSTLDETIIDSQIVSVFDLLYRNYSEKLIHYKRKMNPAARFQSEEALRVLLEEILSEEEFNHINYVQGMLVRNLLHDTAALTEEELKFINNRASLDFVVFYKQDKSCILAIEVDGFAFHENSPRQQKRDRMKDEVLQKYEIPLLRLQTNGSGEAEKIRTALRNNRIS